MPRSVLLVDPDNAHRADFVQKLIGRETRLAGEATDPDEAMRIAALTRPDLAIVATHLHNANGTHLPGRLAAEHAIPSILLSCSTESLLASQASESGVMGMLVHPLEPATLQAVTEMAVCRFQEALTLRREVAGLRRLLESRKAIERAKGFLMEIEGIPEQEAFARLRQKSMDTQRPMVEIARAIILAAEVSGRAR